MHPYEITWRDRVGHQMVHRPGRCALAVGVVFAVVVAGLWTLADGFSPLVLGLSAASGVVFAAAWNASARRQNGELRGLTLHEWAGFRRGLREAAQGRPFHLEPRLLAAALSLSRRQRRSIRGLRPLLIVLGALLVFLGLVFVGLNLWGPGPDSWVPPLLALFGLVLVLGLGWYLHQVRRLAAGLERAGAGRVG